MPFEGVSSIELFKLFGRILIDNDEANRSISDTENRANKTSKSFSEMVGSAAKVGVGIATAMGTAALAVGGLAVKLTDDLQQALNSVQMQTGLVDEAMVGMKDTMLEIYNANLGENFDDIGRAMAEVNKQTWATGEELKGLTKNALLLRDTFEFEVAESTRAADMMMKQFGITGDEAFNLIAQGAQFGLDKNQNLLDTINEYSVHFKQLGFDAEDMFNMLSNGAATGVFDIDKLGDAVKEFGIRVKDGSKASTEAFQSLGLDAGQMSAAFAQGGDAAQDAFNKTIDALFALKDPLQQEQIGVALFGTMWEDVGAKGIQALTSTQGEIDKTTDALGKINELKYDSFGEAVQAIKRNLETSILLPLGEQIMPIMSTFANWIIANMPVIKNEIEFAMGVAKEVFDAIWGVIETYVLPQFIALYNMISQNMPQIKAAIQDMYNYVKPSFDNLVNVIKTNLLPIIQGLWDLVQRAMPTIKVIFEVAMGAVGFALKTAMDVISIFIGAVKGIYDMIKPPLELVIDIFNKVAGAIQWALDKLLFWNKTEAKEKTVKVGEIKSIGHNASGTNYWRGGWTWVGEQGPEIVNLPRGAQIFPADVSAKMATTVGLTGPTINIYYPNVMDDYGVDRLMDRVVERLALKGVK